MVVSQVGDRAVFNANKMEKLELAAMDKLFVGLNTFEPGQEHKLHTHRGQDKLYFVVKGEGDVTVGQETTRIRKGDLVAVRADEAHALTNPGPERLVVMVVMAPPPEVKGQRTAVP